MVVWILRSTAFFRGQEGWEKKWVKSSRLAAFPKCLRNSDPLSVSSDHMGKGIKPISSERKARAGAEPAEE